MSLKITASGILGLLLVSGCGGSGNDADVLNPDAFVNVATTLDETDTDDALDTSSSDLQLGDAGLCTREGMNAWVDAQMRDYYIYADQVPTVDPTEYNDTRSLVNDLRVLPDIYSSVSPESSRTAFFEEGETFGFGFRWRRDEEGVLRFINIVSGSPLDDAGVQRGDRVIALNGIPELSITDTMFDEIFGENGVPTTITFTIGRDDVVEDIDVTSAVYVINTVGAAGLFTRNGIDIGYIELSSFLRNSEAELDRALEGMLSAAPADLILDFRYNGGGFVFVAQKLAAQIAGTNFSGEVFQSTEFNERYSEFNRASVLEPQELNLNLPRIIILTTGRTASAAEAVANNLRPYIDVVLIGSETGGKPFVSVGNPNCGEVLSAMDRIASNGDGETVLGGMTPTCQVQDEFFYRASDTRDALLGAALTYVQTGTCPATTNPLSAGQLVQRSDGVSSARSGSTTASSDKFKAPIDQYDDLRLPPPMMIE